MDLLEQCSTLQKSGKTIKMNALMFQPTLTLSKTAATTQLWQFPFKCKSVVMNSYSVAAHSWWLPDWAAEIQKTVTVAESSK